MRWVLGLLLPLGSVLLLLPRWAGSDAGQAYDGAPEFQRALAAGVSARLIQEPSGPTGVARYDGEWALAVRIMAGLGYGQLFVEQGDPEYRDAMTDALQPLLDDRRFATFDEVAWGRSPFDDLNTERCHRPHVAFLGYLNLALSLQRFVDDGAPTADSNDQISSYLDRCYQQATVPVLETYPGERYPVDNAAALASLGLHTRATGTAHPGYPRGIDAIRDCVDKETGLLYQAVDEDGRPVDLPRGSGTALASYFLSFSDPELSRALFEALERHLRLSAFGFGAVREYAPGVLGFGDIDSGPVVFGAGVSATGFALGAARANAHEDVFRECFATAVLIGAPLDDGRRRSHVLGSAIGDSLLFAMMTAQPSHRWHR
ncbi:MAG: hypothetical protein AAGF12_42110 [Myxococcota bacterium]